MNLTQSSLRAFQLEREYKNQLANLQANDSLFTSVIAAFPEGEHGVIRVNFMYGAVLSINISGTYEDLLYAYRVLYSHGLGTDEKARELQTDLSAYFALRETKGIPYHQRPSIYLRFTSTVCKRVQVGEETVTIPKYDIRCE